jgi:tripartite ATP-independent transporter DctP family solute receptor
MTTKKSVKFLLFSIIFLIATSTGSWAQKPIKIRIASYDPPLVLDFEKTNGFFASTNSKAQLFKSIIESKSNGRMQVEIIPNGQIGGDQAAFEMLQSGALDLSAYPGSTITNWVPELNVVSIPFMFPNDTVAQEVLNGSLGDELRALTLKKTGVRVLRWGTETYLNYMTTDKKVKVPKDLKGLKIRTAPAPYVVAMTKLTGASPTPIPYGEVYTSLQQGVVDGCVTLLGIVEFIKLEQVLKHISKVDISYLISNIAVSEKFWQKLTPEDQNLVMDAACQGSDFFRAMMLYATHLYTEKLEKTGLEIHVATPEERAEWKNVMHEPMIKWTREKIGDEWVDKTLKAVAEAEKRLLLN